MATTKGGVQQLGSRPILHQCFGQTQSALPQSVHLKRHHNLLVIKYVRMATKASSLGLELIKGDTVFMMMQYTQICIS